MAEPEPVSEGSQSPYKKTINKILDALRPTTTTPPADQLPKGVTSEQYADMKNLTELLDVITGISKSEVRSYAEELKPRPNTKESPAEAELVKKIYSMPLPTRK
jgi:hypothetical protein